MKWMQLESFLVQPTQQNVPVIEIFTDLDKPKPLALVYNPLQEHALLFRDDKIGLILDYLDPKSIQLFNQASEVAVCEIDEEKECVRNYYRVPLKKVTDKLNIQLMTKMRV